MPFKSAAQRRFLYSQKPDVAAEFARKERQAENTDKNSMDMKSEKYTYSSTDPDKTKKKPPINRGAVNRRQARNGNADSSTAGY